MSAIALYKVAGGGVVGQVRIGRRFNFCNDLLREDLAQLYPPLIKRIDRPDNALREDSVLVERDERAEDCRREQIRKDGVGGAVALEDLVGDKHFGDAFGAHLRGGLAEGERLGLGEDVSHQHVMMASERIERLSKADEVAGDQPRALMDELVEAVLAVGSGFA